MWEFPFHLQDTVAIPIEAAPGELNTFWINKERVEPRSVLDHWRSPSTPTSTSTFSSLGVPAVSQWPEEGAAVAELQLPVPTSLELGLVAGADDWGSIVKWTAGASSLPQDSALPALTDPFPVLETLVAASASEEDAQNSTAGFPLIPANDPPFPLPLPPQLLCHNPLSSCSTPLFLPPSPYHHSMAGMGGSQPPLLDSGQDLFLLRQHPALDQLLKAAEMVAAGNFAGACLILARLNHQLSPSGKPFLRSAFYFKEALLNFVSSNYVDGPSSLMPAASSPSTLPASTLDVILKLNAYRAFSDILPYLQFTSFTCIQAILEELDGCNRIHIVDFDIGIGGQWSSFIQELSMKCCSTAAADVLSLRITAVVSPLCYHPLELILTRENLSHFANELNIPFEFNILSIDSFDPNAILGCDEAIAVSIPMDSTCMVNPTFLQQIKQLSPKIVVSINHGFGCNDLSFAQYFRNALHSCTFLLESIDFTGAKVDVVSKIEQFLLQPRIESSVSARYLASDKMVPWRKLFSLAGFVPIPFSNFAEAQAEHLVKRSQLRGFQIKNHQSSLILLWQHGELASVSTWRC